MVRLQCGAGSTSVEASVPLWNQCELPEHSRSFIWFSWILNVSSSSRRLLMAEVSAKYRRKCRPRKNLEGRCEHQTTPHGNLSPVVQQAWHSTRHGSCLPTFVNLFRNMGCGPWELDRNPKCRAQGCDGRFAGTSHPHWLQWAFRCTSRIKWEWQVSLKNTRAHTDTHILCVLIRSYKVIFACTMRRQNVYGYTCDGVSPAHHFFFRSLCDAICRERGKIRWLVQILCKARTAARPTADDNLHK